jgi:hypothetical protein
LPGSLGWPITEHDRIHVAIYSSDTAGNSNTRCSGYSLLLRGRSYGHVAERFQLSKTTIYRHAKRCIAPAIASAADAREASFADLVNALDRLTNRLRKLTTGPERFRLEQWNEWARASAQVERWVGLRLKASRRLSTAPAAGSTSVNGTTLGVGMTLEQANAQLIEMCKDQTARNALLLAAYRADQATGRVSLLPCLADEELTLLLSGALIRERLRILLIVVDEELEMMWSDPQRAGARLDPKIVVERWKQRDRFSCDTKRAN